ncbi:putative Uncharacterized protein family (UPF0172) [Trypanosoma vivax]|uniref:MPN domain-containing protein n=1 Tax=Trypanosoma vivax (strain Y486) TaxID=1055687 RepID=G0U095_TRYVY|nr:hypothetical protein TRVL_03001 [Trypanosoma vivax]KAH8614023.1 putative Uncharacterized protein family (UPF0172) [Trypanosoma vivax]CCC49493.1 conserved hypothetical protein [Trypanosoma vivax Y486]
MASPLSASTPPVVTSVDAYVKALLHCQKYPTQPVAGFLIGKRISENGVGSSGANAEDTDRVFVADSVPLFHAIMMTSPHPMMSVAYAQVSTYARTKGLVLLGYYVANEHVGDTTVSPLTEKVLRMLHSRKSGDYQPLLWRIVSLQPTESPDVLAAYYNSTNSCLTEASSLTFGCWNSDTLSCETTVSKATAVEILENSLDALKQFQLVDFEDHLESVQLNYLEQAAPA